MSDADQSAMLNRLLSIMAADDFARLEPHLKPITLVKSVVVAEVDEPFENVLFPESGVVSIVAVSPEGLEVEAGLYGREGMGPIAAVLGVNVTSNRINIQIPGKALSIALVRFQDVMDTSATLRVLLNRYAQTMMVQTSYTALSNAVHPVAERLARWLLMCDDRSDGDLELTHEFLSIMLAVRRPSVTTALHVLEGNGFIRAERGFIAIRNRQALEEFAGDGYGRAEAAYRKLIGPMR